MGIFLLGICDSQHSLDSPKHNTAIDH